MWLILNDAFFSIVQKDCARGEVLVRARRKGDIEKVFPGAKVARGAANDYLYRARIQKDDVKRALAIEVDRVTYPNFKDSVADPELHRACLRVWWAMQSIDERGGPSPSFDVVVDDLFASAKKRKRGRRAGRKRRRRSLARGR